MAPRLLVPVYTGIWQGPLELPEHVKRMSNEAMLMWYNYGRRVSVISAFGDRGHHLSMTAWPKDWNPANGYGRLWAPQRITDMDFRWCIDQFDPLEVYTWTEVTAEGIVARHAFGKPEVA